jgi:hypothetical protein
MEIGNRRVWQVGAGDGDRIYDEMCIKCDLMLVGPGERGTFDEGRYADYPDIRNSIRRFYQDAKQGDIVLLRLGTGKICAVGEIADDSPQWLDEFGDVDGWDLQHVRRVRWFPNTQQTFPAKTLGGQVKTFANVGVTSVLDWLTTVDVPSEQKTRLLATVPQSSETIDPAILANQLFIEGLPSEYIDKLLVTLSSIRRVAEWYWNKQKRPKGRPSESETVAYLVVPLLFALGWSQQTAAIEWNNVDVALFSRMPSEDNTLVGVVEAKSLDSSVFSPFGQALDYALRPGRTLCNRLVVTDGIRYALHERTGDEFKLQAYLNILRMRRQYFALSCGGAVHALIGMAPTAVVSAVSATTV